MSSNTAEQQAGEDERVGLQGGCHMPIRAADRSIAAEMRATRRSRLGPIPLTRGSNPSGSHELYRLRKLRDDLFKTIAFNCVYGRSLDGRWTSTSEALHS